MIEQVDETEPEELNCKTIQNWYEHASNELSIFCNLQFPKFPTKLPESALIFNEELQIEHALGQAYYPCVGGDKETIVDIFSAASTQIVLSNTGFGRHFIDHVGNLNLSKKMSSPKTTDNYHFYKQDGIVTFLTAIDQLSVFFHRSDSTGEGGSNQLWFKEVLFPLVLSKMRNKGLLITDGSLCGYFDDVFDYYVPWNAMCGEEPYSRPKISTNFKWSNFHFKCVAKIPPNTFVWQVENIK